MKIGFIGPLAPFRGGVAHFNQFLVDGMKKNGHELIQISFKQLYPRFLFPPSATDLIPDLPGMAHLRVTVGRVEPPGDDPEEPVVLGLEFAWEPTSYDPATALPAAWERLRGHRESAFMTAIHRSLNQLSGQLEHEGPMGVDG